MADKASPDGVQRTAAPATPGAAPAAPRDNHEAAPGRRLRFWSRPQATGHVRDGSNFREIVETVVFVVVLVLLLKTFTAEAFVIPTGSMATTLWGYQKYVDCPKCGHHFPVNCSDEAEAKAGRPHVAVTSAICPNCRYPIVFRDEHMNPGCNSGDRVLVVKYFFDTGIRPPNRLDVVVFKYPKKPEQEFTPMNYIKRLIGLPGETIGIYYGKLYVMKAGAAGDLYKDPFPRTYHLKVKPGSGFDANVIDVIGDNGVPAAAAEVKVTTAGTPPTLRFDGRNPVAQDLDPRDTGVEIKVPGGETRTVHQSNLAVARIEVGNNQEGSAAADVEVTLSVPPKDRWWKEYMYVDKARDLLERGDPRFEILRKSPDKILALRRLVYDNDHPAKDLEGRLPPRWKTGPGWSADNDHAFHHPSGDGGKDFDWLAYRHVLRPEGEPTGQEPPELITDFIGYNTANASGIPQDWVGDLIVECEAAFDRPEGELALELNKGVDRFRAHWKFTGPGAGAWTVSRRRGDAGRAADWETLATAPAEWKGQGAHKLRFANVDERLTLWVDEKLPFGPEGVNYPPPARRGPTKDDLQPAAVGIKGGGTVRHLTLWRDTYYTLNPGAADVSAFSPGDPERWDELRSLPARTLYVQPEPRHYLCLGDNSTASSDSRDWGLVPERLVLGRALVTYYPFYFPIPPFNSPHNRVGWIR